MKRLADVGLSDWPSSRAKYAKAREVIETGEELAYTRTIDRLADSGWHLISRHVMLLREILRSHSVPLEVSKDYVASLFLFFTHRQFHVSLALRGHTPTIQKTIPHVLLNCSFDHNEAFYSIVVALLGLNPASKPWFELRYDVNIFIGRPDALLTLEVRPDQSTIDQVLAIPFSCIIPLRVTITPDYFHSLQ